MTQDVGSSTLSDRTTSGSRVGFCGSSSEQSTARLAARRSVARAPPPAPPCARSSAVSERPGMKPRKAGGSNPSARSTLFGRPHGC